MPSKTTETVFSSARAGLGVVGRSVRGGGAVVGAVVVTEEKIRHNIKVLNPQLSSPN